MAKDHWFWRLSDWLGRGQTWWGIGSVCPSVWAFFEARAAGMTRIEIFLFTLTVLVLTLCGAYYLRYFLGYLGERAERIRVVELLHMRQEAGFDTVLLQDVAAVWHGKKMERGNVVEEWMWNAKFRRLKRAVETKEIDGELIDGNKSIGNISDLIRYFNSRRD